jgi:hypothetical protein
MLNESKKASRERHIDAVIRAQRKIGILFGYASNILPTDKPLTNTPPYLTQLWSGDEAEHCQLKPLSAIETILQETHFSMSDWAR